MTKFVNGYKGRKVPYEYFTEKDSNGLMIVLPGVGYTAMAPLLYYSDDLAIMLKADVLKVNYRYNDEEYDDLTQHELVEAIRFDVKTVIDAILSEKRYENFYFIAKSIGTIPLCTELGRKEFDQAKVIWLTPLIHRDDVLQAMVESKQKGLCIIGDEDRVYDKERYEKILGNGRIKSRLVAGAGHALDIEGKPLDSVDLLKSIVVDMEEFLLND